MYFLQEMRFGFDQLLHKHEQTHSKREWDAVRRNTMRGPSFPFDASPASFEAPFVQTVLEDIQTAMEIRLKSELDIEEMKRRIFLRQSNVSPKVLGLPGCVDFRLSSRSNWTWFWVQKTIYLSSWKATSALKIVVPVGILLRLLDTDFFFPALFCIIHTSKSRKLPRSKTLILILKWAVWSSLFLLGIMAGDQIDTCLSSSMST